MWLGTKEKPNVRSSNHQQQHETGIFRTLFLSDQHASWKIELTCKKRELLLSLRRKGKGKKNHVQSFKECGLKVFLRPPQDLLLRHIIEACLQAITNLKGGNKSLSSQS